MLHKKTISTKLNQTTKNWEKMEKTTKIGLVCVQFYKKFTSR